MISSKEFEAVIRLNPFDRYKYLIKKFADSETIFCLQDFKNNLAIADLDGNKVVSFWPTKEFAQSCATGSWTNYSVFDISLDLFMKRFVPVIKTGKYLLNIFSVEGQTGFIVDIEEFMRDLSDELNKYS